jgi:hypothetical protein
LARTRSVVCAQNGVVNEVMAARRFGSVYAMVVNLPAEHLAPGVVVLHGVPTPANRVLQRIGNEMARRRLAPGHFKVAELVSLIDAERRQRVS